MSSAAQTTRQQLLQQETQFLTTPQEKRFSRLLSSRLLAEGCNLPLPMARCRFRILMLEGVRSRLDGSAGTRFDGLVANNGKEIDHVHFNLAMRHVATRVEEGAKTMVKVSLGALTAIKRDWQREATFFQQEQRHYERDLVTIVHAVAHAHPAGEISRRPIGTIRRRLNMGLTVSLLRYIKDGRKIQERFGTVPQALAAMGADHAVFRRAMALFFEEIPYAGLVVSQAFWRLIQTLDLEDQGE